MPLTWNEELQKKLIAEYGQKKGTFLDKKYSSIFPHNYKDEYSPQTALEDIAYIEKLTDEDPLEVNLYLSEKTDDPLHLRLYQWQKPIPLSDVLPMLENFDLRTNNEQPFKMLLDDNHIIWISDFSVIYNRRALEIEKAHDLFKVAFEKIYQGIVENDGFNKLILCVELSWREIVVFRAYAKYLRQVGFRFTQPYIEKTLADNPAISRDLLDLFITMNDPSKAAKEKNKAKEIEERILKAVEKVASLDEDRIIRRMLDLIKATLRTNYFQTNKDGSHKEFLTFKFSSKMIPELPLPQPMFDLFVYSPRFEAIHLRNTKVARGGIRWSDRREDFRTEILGLMKAQVVKNAVIVPSGAKGGFVLKSNLSNPTREVLQAEVIYCYKAFINAMLDITDNIVAKKHVRPAQVYCHDDFDPYLVVAADKGTSAFSDIANEISKEHHFWLMDAFASGGSTGYDHKKMGITARGTWESIKRHFRELNVDPTRVDITVIGIGDMSGDVFGNGMLYTKRIRLVAAFDHRNIFVDPDPHAEASYAERQRLFDLPVSTWEDYNPNLISKGGGVFKRSVKSITLTKEMRQALGTEETSLTPNDLIRTILKAPVDLLFNGGIGTYVKASSQTQAEVGDRTNDYCRINGDELRCKVVGEGGNLGFTQLGRVEYALKGGLINTDFIDNSGGVDCSDHEVNLKILLDQEVVTHKLTEHKRNELLKSVTDEVAELVLKDNYEQALVLSFSSYHAKQNIALYTNYIKELDSLKLFNRRVECIPDDKALLERKAAGEGLTKPELAVLLAYTKIHIKTELLKSKLPEDPYLKKVLITAFPYSLRKKYQHAMDEHRLHRDIIATQLSNQVINEMGITFVYRLQMETGASVDEIVRAHAVASHIFGTQEIQKLIQSLDFQIPLSEQYEMLFNIRHLINLATRWFLQGTYLKGNLEELIKHFSVRVKTLEQLTPELMGGFTKKYLETLTDRFLRAGLPKEMAKRIATYRAIYTALNIIDVSTRHDFDLGKTAEVYFKAGERTNLLWFRDQIANDTREGHWNALARLTLRDELDLAQRALTVSIMKFDENEKDSHQLIERWLAYNARQLKRWERHLELLHGSSSVEYTMFFIAMKELYNLISNSIPPGELNY